jgi:sporulation protein YlmC with PRC-barrel domain
MQRTVNNELGHNLQATDGVLGHVEDFFFDDSTWTIRYLVVKTGTWLFGRKVLISRNALVQHSWESGIFPVNLTQDQVRNSPDIDTVEPVSRQQEEELASYYAYEPYWGTGFNPGESIGVIPTTPVFDPGEIINREKKPTGDPHLRSCREIHAYHIDAHGDEIGRVDDFLMDDETWKITHLIVDTHTSIGGRKVLVAVGHIEAINWADKRVTVDLSVDAIKHGAPVDKWDYIIPEGDMTVQGIA